MLMFRVFEILEEDFGRGMVFGLASFWSWGFLGRVCGGGIRRFL